MRLLRRERVSEHGTRSLGVSFPPNPTVFGDCLERSCGPGAATLCSPSVLTKEKFRKISGQSHPFRHPLHCGDGALSPDLWDGKRLPSSPNGRPLRFLFEVGHSGKWLYCFAEMKVNSFRRTRGLVLALLAIYVSVSPAGWRRLFWFSLGVRSSLPGL